jgi:hypothetical protein
MQLVFLNTMYSLTKGEKRPGQVRVRRSPVPLSCFTFRFRYLNQKPLKGAPLAKCSM